MDFYVKKQNGNRMEAFHTTCSFLGVHRVGFFLYDVTTEIGCVKYNILQERKCARVCLRVAIEYFCMVPHCFPDRCRKPLGFITSTDRCTVPPQRLVSILKLSRSTYALEYIFKPCNIVTTCPSKLLSNFHLRSTVISRGDTSFRFVFYFVC